MKNTYLIVILIIVSIISLFIGVNGITINDLLQNNMEKIEIMYLSRIPRLFSIIIAGMAMSISGMIMQQISKNKFVSPTTAGTIDSAKLGLLVSIVVFKSNTIYERMIISFIFALLGTFLFVNILNKVKVKSSVMIPLIGIMIGNIIDSITTFIAYRYDLVQNISSWLMGDFSMIIKGRYELLFLSIPLLIMSYIYANKFTIAGMGEDFSVNLGLNYKRVVNIGISIVALLSSVVIIIVGRIPFLGLIIPNIVSLINGDNMKNNVLTTALFGSIFLLLCDILGRIIIYPYEVSISLTVGIIGSIVFLFLLFRGTNNE